MFKQKKSWISDFWYRGERYKKSHGPVSKTRAKELDRAFRSEVASGDYIKAKHNPKFSEAVQEALKRSKAKNAASSYKEYIRYGKYLSEHFGQKRIRSIENDEILMRKYIKKRQEQIREKQLARGRNITEVTYTTINRELAFMRSMYNVLIRAGKATKNPVSLVTFFEEVEKERVLTEAEEDRIFQAITELDVRYHHMTDIITVALNTAMRLNEILGMEKSWINFKDGIINVPRFAQKRKRKDKRVPVNSVIEPILQRLVRQNKACEYVFVNPKTGTRYTSIHNAWDTIIKKAGIEGRAGVDKLRFHDLRHTAATNLARKAGKDIKFIAQYLGHSDVKTSARYIHYSDEDLKAGAEALVRVPPNFTPPKIVKR